MTASRKNTIYILLVLLSLGLIFFHEKINTLISEYLDSARDPVIATLYDTSGTVRHKPKKTIQVKSAYHGKELRSYDTIYTEKNSTAKITFITDDQILVLPNSEIVISLPKGASNKENISVTFIKGNFKVLKKAPANLNSKKEITIVKGNVQRSIASLSVSPPELEPTVTPEIVEETPQPEPIAEEPVVIEPVPEKPTFTAKEYKYEIWKGQPTSISKGFEPAKKTNLKWSESPTADTYYQVQLSSKEDFSTLETEENLTSNSASLDVASGSYYARVRSYSKTQTSEWSDPAKVRVLNAPPTNLKFSHEDDETYLDWTGNSNQSRYELEVVSPENKKSTYYLNRNHHIYLPKTEGKYSWKVREVNESKWPASRWSKSSQFDYVMPRTLAAVEEPTVEVKEEEVTLPTKAKEVAKIKIEKPKAKRLGRLTAQAKLGMNIFSGSQSGSTLLERSNFSSVAYTSVSLGLGYGWKRNYFGVFYDLSPLKFKPESGVTADKDSFNLQTIGVEGVYNFSKRDQRFQNSIKVAAQEDTTPFFTPGSSTNVSILTNKTYSMKLGIETKYNSSKKMEYVFAAAYLHPFSSSLDGVSSFEMNPSYSVLGSAGLNYSLSANSMFQALYSYQKTEFDYTYSTASLGSLSGSHSTQESKFLFGFKYLFFTTLVFPTIRTIRRNRKKRFKKN